MFTTEIITIPFKSDFTYGMSCYSSCIMCICTNIPFKIVRAVFSSPYSAFGYNF